MKRSVAFLPVLLLTLSLMPVAFAFQEEAQPAVGKDIRAIQGELARVDMTANIIALRMADGSELEFIYNDQTEISGQESTVEGLSSKAGNQVTVHYRDADGSNIAVKVEVHAQP